MPSQLRGSAPTLRFESELGPQARASFMRGSSANRHRGSPEVHRTSSRHSMPMQVRAQLQQHRSDSAGPGRDRDAATPRESKQAVEPRSETRGSASTRRGSPGHSRQKPTPILSVLRNRQATREEVEEVVAGADWEAIDLQARDFASVMGVLKRKRAWQQAIALLDVMARRSVAPDAAIYGNLVSTCAKAGPWAGALMLFEQMQQAAVAPDNMGFSAAILACEKGGLWQGATALLDQMWEDLGSAPEENCFITAISACTKSRRWESAIALLDTMSQARISPSILTFNATIGACWKSGQWECALALLDEIKAMGNTPNSTTFSVVISSCGKGKQWQLALALSDDMAQAGVATDAVAFNALIGACEKSGQWERTLHLLENMMKLGVKPNIISFSGALRACEQEGRWQHALALLGPMRRERLDLDGAAVGTLVSACERACQWQQALTVLDQLAEERGSSTISGAGLEAAIRACEQGGQWTRALSLLERLEQEHPDGAGPGARASAAGTNRRPGNWEKAAMLLAQMQAARGPVDTASVNSSSGTSERGGERDGAAGPPTAGKAPRVMRSKGPDVNVADHAELAERLRPLVRQCLTEFASAGASSATFASLYGVSALACARDARWELALRLLEEMPLRGLRPGVATYSAAAEACVRGGQWERAQKLLRDMRTGVLHPAGVQGATPLDKHDETPRSRVSERYQVARGSGSQADAAGGGDVGPHFVAGRAGDATGGEGEDAMHEAQDHGSEAMFTAYGEHAGREECTVAWEQESEEDPDSTGSQASDVIVEASVQ